MNYNKAIVIGNITRDPELKTTPSGTSVCTFSIATNRTWFDKNANTKKEEVEFHNIVAWGKTGELVHQYMKRGNQIMIEGRLQTRSWEGKDGKKNYRTEIVAENIQFGQRPAGQTSAPAPARTKQEGAYPSDIVPSDDFMGDVPAATEQTEDINVEDIPF